MVEDIWIKRSIIFVILKAKETFPTCLLLGSRKGNDAKLLINLLARSILAERCVGTREHPEIYQIGTQNQAKQNDWPKEIGKKCPYKWFNHHEDVILSLSLPLCLSTWNLLSPNKHSTCFTAFNLCGNSFLQSHVGQGLVTGHWSLMV